MIANNDEIFPEGFLQTQTWAAWVERRVGVRLSDGKIRKERTNHDLKISFKWFVIVNLELRLFESGLNWFL